MCVYVCVRVCACVHACMCVCVHVCVHVCVLCVFCVRMRVELARTIYTVVACAQSAPLKKRAISTLSAPIAPLSS